MARARRKVAVVGCGTAGPAAAVLLRRQGDEVVLFERAAECRAVGAGFLLQPSGMAVLEELGVLDEVLSRAARVKRLHVVDPRGRSLLDLNYGEIGDSSFGAGLHRPVLLNALLGLMERESVKIEWGTEITGARRIDGKWSLEAEGQVVCDGVDLLIVADGAEEGSGVAAFVVQGVVDRRYFPPGMFLAVDLC